MERTVADVSAHPFIRFLQMFRRRQVPISLNKGLGRVNLRDLVGFRINSDGIRPAVEINRATCETAVAENISVTLNSYLRIKYLNISEYLIPHNTAKSANIFSCSHSTVMVFIVK